MEVLFIDEWLNTQKKSSKLIKGYFIVLEDDGFIITHDNAFTPEQVKKYIPNNIRK